MKTGTFDIPTELLTRIKAAHNVLCISHVNADGDAYGSVLGMVWMLRSLGKRATAAMPDPLLPDFTFLPGAGEIVGPTQTADDYDLIICLDMSSADRMGAVYNEARFGAIPLVVIDHHITNTNFGVVNWVEPRCAATAQMLVVLSNPLGIEVDTRLAECLLTGIVTDTLCFRTSNTTPEVLEAAMCMQRAGADLSDIVRQTLNRMPFSTLQLWSAVLADAQIDQGVTWVTVSQEHLRQAGHEGDDSRLNSILSSVNEADMSAVFTEKLGANGSPAVECSFRAKPGFNVGELAFQLGGGGHAPASGCTLAGSLADVVGSVVPMLIAERRRQLAHTSATPQH